MSYAEVVWIFFGFQTILAHLGIVSNMFSTWNWTCLRCIIIPHGDLGQVHGQRPVEAAAPVRGRRGGLVRHRPKQTPPWTCLQVLLSSWSTQRQHVNSSSFIIHSPFSWSSSSSSSAGISMATSPASGWMPLDQVRCQTQSSWLSYIHQVRLRQGEF